MKRVLRGMPRLRNALVLGLAGLAARIPDDHPEVIAAPTHAVSEPPCNVLFVDRPSCSHP